MYYWNLLKDNNVLPADDEKSHNSDATEVLTVAGLIAVVAIAIGLLIISLITATIIFKSRLVTGAIVKQCPHHFQCFTRRLIGVGKVHSLDNKNSRVIEGHELQEVTDRVEENIPLELETTVGNREINGRGMFVFII